jgi:signal transduction histidine kinase
LTGKDIHFTLSDDGKGFCQLSVNDQSSRSLSGNGLENLRNRAEELSAKLEINSLPGQGTTISLIFQVALSNLTIY